jgi:hypothetical protein
MALRLGRDTAAGKRLALLGRQFAAVRPLVSVAEVSQTFENKVLGPLPGFPSVFKIGKSFRHKSRSKGI